ncbi:ABC transporter ATP-binding protein [Thalassobaculum salexigens]|uniref:ABC transporter ATP-binding protein n=1 Tax=Thalassobaculum salexigens TaxID=455360 RepID=UPI0004290797|nr:ABC transporter ATP-binding protein [Thalassobaculum salexigens]
MTQRLELDGVTVTHAEGVAVDHASFSCASGEVVAVMGANGAGKSSLIRALAGAEPLSSGAIRVDGQDVTGMRLEQRVRAGIGWCPEGRRLFAGLTVAETLDVAATGGAAERAAAFERIFTLFPVLKERRDATAWTLSGGQQQMLAIARAVISEPRVVLLDEPSIGLAPVVLDDVFATIRRLAESGAAVVLAEQAVPRALAIADRAIVLRRGVIVLDVPAERIDAGVVASAMLDAGSERA